MISPVTLPDVSGVAGGVMGNIFEGVVLGTAGVALFAPVVLGVLAILAVPKVLVEFLFGVLILWRTGAGAIFSLSVKRSRQLVKSKLVPGNIAIERCDGEERCRGEGAKSQDTEKVWKETGNGVGERNLETRECPGNK